MLIFSDSKFRPILQQCYQEHEEFQKTDHQLYKYHSRRQRLSAAGISFCNKEIRNQITFQ